VTEPVDWLNQRIQHLDSTPRPLMTLSSPAMNPFHQTFVQLSRLITEPFEQTPLRCLLHHYANEPSASRVEMLRSIIVSVSCMIGQLYWRLILPLSTWPFPLVVLADCAADHRDMIVAAFLAACMCCLDAGFSRKLRFFHSSASTLTADTPLMEILTLFASRFKWCNMHIERLLALCKAAAPQVHIGD
jgi:hypothetical protein